MHAVSAIVLAAGSSTRFGGPNKLLQPWGSSTVVGTVADTLRACGLKTIVVTGRDADAVALATGLAEAVFNPKFELGMGTSIAVGVGSCPPGGVLIALGDMPGLLPDVVRAIVGAYSDPAQIILPVYESDPLRPGHPVLFGAAHRPELAALTGDSGAREIIRSHPDCVVKVRVSGSLSDIDLPSDLPD